MSATHPPVALAVDDPSVGEGLLMTRLTFEYSSVHGALAAAYTSGSLAAEFGAEQVRVALPAEAEQRGWPAPLLAELSLAEARRQRLDTRLLGIVPDGDGPAWALITSHVRLERDRALLVRALCAVLLARPHRRPVLDAALVHTDLAWVDEQPLGAATLLATEEFAVPASGRLHGEWALAATHWS